MGSVAPTDFLDTCWGPLNTHVFILRVLECLQLFFGNLWDLDNLLLTFTLFSQVLVADILEALKGAPLVFTHLLLVNIDCLS